MGSFQRGFLGYRRAQVDAAIAVRDARIAELERELSCISGMIVEREREIRDVREELRLANERNERSIASLEVVSRRIEEIQAQARGQATRIRMRALSEAVEVSRRVQVLAGRIGGEQDGVATGEATPATGEAIPATGEATPATGEATPAEPSAALAEPVPFASKRPFEGPVRVEVGPLADFSQLVAFEDAAAQIEAATDISVERFSEGRATLALTLERPTELVRELTQRSPLHFRIREAEGGRIVLDVEAPARQAA
ncbi:MAG: hypothetical protein U0R52_01170 [Solirubrobacterales bacterium]